MNVKALAGIAKTLTFGAAIAISIFILNLNRLTIRLLRSEALLQQQQHEVATFPAFNIINVTMSPENAKLLLAVGVLNQIKLRKRREAIRMTWLKVCKSKTNRHLVRCNFFTDSLDQLEKKEDAEKVLEENQEHNDMLFMPIKGGHRFTERLLWMMEWYTKHYQFEYFLRIDDDYFLCMDRLLYELPFRPKLSLYWGWVHCRANTNRVDEGWMMLSRDIIDEALAKLNSTLPCHPFGDQAVALWVRDSKLKIKWFPDNERIVHAAVVYNERKYIFPNFCGKYLAMHGSYQDQMLKYWILMTEDNNNNHQKKLPGNLKPRYHIPPVPDFYSVCHSENAFDVNEFWPEYRFQPKLCKDKPEWSVTKERFIGREISGPGMMENL